MATSTTGQQLTPPAFMQLAGHPLRWKLLRELGRSDRSVHELTDLLGQPQNLVSYHLAKLREAHLVSSRRSSADRRDAYYALDLSRVRSLLTATGVALHPGLRLAPPASDAPNPGVRPVARVLFLCTGNSARSPMAEALARTHSGGLVETASAGSNPKPLHPLAVQVMQNDHGIDLAGHRSKHLDELTDDHFDRVISLCDRVREVCPEFPGRPETVHWSIPDPGAASGDESGYPAFQRTADDLATRIEFLLADLTRPPDPDPTTTEVPP